MSKSDAVLDKPDAVTEAALTVILKKTASNWCAFTPDDIGVVVATGMTRDEVVENFRSALKSHLEVMAEEGMPLPTITGLEIRETTSL